MMVKDGDRYRILVKPHSSVLGRKNCTSCKRWRHLADYPCEKRNNQIYIRSECHCCAKTRRRDWYARKSPAERRRTHQKWYENRGPTAPLVDSWETRRWIIEQMEKGATFEKLAWRLSLTREQVRDLERGYTDAMMPIRRVPRGLSNKIRRARGELLA